MRAYLTREFYIPKEATQVADKESDAVAYLQDRPHARTGETIYVLVAFCGKRAKPDLNYIYRTAAARQQAIDNYFAGRRQSVASKAERRAARNQGNRLEVGTVLVGSWGYDQTNVEAWQVVELVGRCSVNIRRIATVQTRELGDMAADVIPAPDQFVDAEIVFKRVVSANHVSMDHCTLRPWDGRPMYRSWYA
jgi:hypothetical protein